MRRDRFCALYHSGAARRVINAQRQILRPLSFRFRKLGDKRAETNSTPLVILHTFSLPRGDRVQQNAETNYGHSASCINREEQIRQYQDDVSVLIIFRFLQVPLTGRFTGRKVFRSNEISVLSLLPFYLQ